MASEISPNVPDAPFPQVAAPILAFNGPSKEGFATTKFPFVRAVTPPSPIRSLLRAPYNEFENETSPTIPEAPFPQVTAPTFDTIG
ncbi:MAG: hypothetical protein IPK98_16360 [Chloracidobacterium sp.]|nr:hypothetical protein [Chloracidobacterium sp.]